MMRIFGAIVIRHGLVRLRRLFEQRVQLLAELVRQAEI